MRFTWLLIPLLLVACSSLHEGKVTDKHYSPAHDEQQMYQQYVGENCVPIRIGNTTSEECTPNYIWLWRTVHIEDDWTVTISAVNPDNGNQDSRTVDVDKATYDKLNIGDHWRVPGE